MHALLVDLNDETAVPKALMSVASPKTEQQSNSDQPQENNRYFGSFS